MLYKVILAIIAADDHKMTSKLSKDPGHNVTKFNGLSCANLRLYMITVITQRL